MIFLLLLGILGGSFRDQGQSMDAIAVVGEILQSALTKGAEHLGEALSDKAATKLFDYIEARYGVAPRVICSHGAEPERLVAQVVDMLRSLGAEQDKTLQALAVAANRKTPQIASVGTGILAETVNANGTIIVSNGTVVIGGGVAGAQVPNESNPTKSKFSKHKNSRKKIESFSKTFEYQKFKDKNDLTFFEASFGSFIVGTIGWVAQYFLKIKIVSDYGIWALFAFAFLAVYGSLRTKIRPGVVIDLKARGSKAIASILLEDGVREEYEVKEGLAQFLEENGLYAFKIEGNEITMALESCTPE